MEVGFEGSDGQLTKVAVLARLKGVGRWMPTSLPPEHHAITMFWSEIYDHVVRIWAGTGWLTMSRTEYDTLVRETTNSDTL